MSLNIQKNWIGLESETRRQIWANFQVPLISRWAGSLRARNKRGWHLKGSYAYLDTELSTRLLLAYHQLNLFRVKVNCELEKMATTNIYNKKWEAWGIKRAICSYISVAFGKIIDFLARTKGAIIPPPDLLDFCSWLKDKKQEKLKINRNLNPIWTNESDQPSRTSWRARVLRVWQFRLIEPHHKRWITQYALRLRCEQSWPAR